MTFMTFYAVKAPEESGRMLDIFIHDDARLKMDDKPTRIKTIITNSQEPISLDAHPTDRWFKITKLGDDHMIGRWQNVPPDDLKFPSDRDIKTAPIAFVVTTEGETIDTRKLQIHIQTLSEMDDETRLRTIAELNKAGNDISGTSQFYAGRQHCARETLTSSPPPKGYWLN